MSLRVILFTSYAFLTLSSAVRLGDMCDTRSYICDSIPNAECIDGSCQCLSGTTKGDGVCLEDFSPLRPCDDEPDCVGPTNRAAVCFDGHCQCQSGYTYRKGTCHKFKGYRESCRENADCYMGHKFVGAMVCSNFKCDCSPGYAVIVNRCRSSKSGTSLKAIPVIFVVISATPLSMIFK